MEQFIHYYIGLAYFQQPIRAMQFNAAKLQKQSRFKSCFKAAFFWSSFKKQRSATQRSSAARRMLRLKAQRSAAYVWTHLHANAAQRSAPHHMLRLKATCIYSAAQRMCERYRLVVAMTRWHYLLLSFASWILFLNPFTQFSLYILPTLYIYPLLIMMINRVVVCTSPNPVNRSRYREDSDNKRHDDDYCH